MRPRHPAGPRCGLLASCPLPAGWWLSAAIFALTALIRGWQWGDPNYHIDEGFYLLVGDRMRHGALPYVDLWDRKPFGLFLIYWAIAAIGGASAGAVQLAAGASAAATAIVLARVARRWVADRVALLVAVTYLAALEALAGGGGQTPVFYNLAIAAMAAWSLRARDAPDRAQLTRAAIAAALCGGIALTIKPTCLPECIVLGGFIAARLVRHSASKRVAMARLALIAAIGVLPSLACVAYFAAIGHGADYLFATIVSATRRLPPSIDERVALARYLVPRLAPLGLMAAAGVALLYRTDRGDATWLVAWIGAAITGFLMVPNFYDHYALPLLPSLCVAAAPLFARPVTGGIFAASVAGWALMLAGWPAVERTQRSRAAMATATDLILANRGGRSLYVFDGPPSLYTLTRAPLPTRWVFPEHLSTSEERDAIGVAPLDELAAILRRHPAVIVAADGDSPRHPSPAAHRLIRIVLAQRYRRVASVFLPDVAGGRRVGIFALRAAAAAPVPRARATPLRSAAAPRS